MTSLWVPAPTPAQVLTEPHLPDSPFHQLLGFTRGLLRDTRDIPAAERRLLLPNFVETFRWAAVRPLLPLRLVVAPTQPAAGQDQPATPPVWQPRYCRSHYVWLPPEETLGQSRAAWQGLDDFDLILRLFDFSAWRPILGQRFASQCGPPPFDPVSLGLAWLLARWRGWSWPQLVTELHSPERGQGYVRRLGFRPDDLPSASTFRMALDDTPPAWVVQCADSLALSLLAYGLMPSHSTFPHDPPERGVSVALDSQLVAARSHLRCRHMNAACFRPPAERHVRRPGRRARRAAPVTPPPARTTVAWPPPAIRRPPTSITAVPTRPTPPRPPPASQPPRTPAAPAPPTSPAAASTTSATRAKPSTSSTTACSPTGRWPAPSPPPTATTICRPSPASQNLRRRFPHLTIGEVTADAGEGYDDILTYVYDDLHALRLVDQRAAKGDADPLTCLTRGYDAQGVPLCPHGYRLAFNGHDYTRRDSKWVCRQRCRRQLQPDIRPPNAQPAPAAPASQTRPAPPVPTGTRPSPWARSSGSA